MLAAEAPWAPIVAFMVASPLTSPSELLLSAGLFGWGFAPFYFAGATGLGFAAGESRAPSRTAGGWQGRRGCDRRPQLVRPPARPRRIAAYFLAYSALGYLVIELMPTGGLVQMLGDYPLWGVPLAALLGVPLYLVRGELLARRPATGGARRAGAGRPAVRQPARTLSAAAQGGRNGLTSPARPAWRACRVTSGCPVAAGRLPAARAPPRREPAATGAAGAA
jgi:hypothetical protein